MSDLTLEELDDYASQFDRIERYGQSVTMTLDEARALLAAARQGIEAKELLKFWTEAVRPMRDELIVAVDRRTRAFLDAPASAPASAMVHPYLGEPYEVPPAQSMPVSEQRARDELTTQSIAADEAIKRMRAKMPSPTSDKPQEEHPLVVEAKERLGRWAFGELEAWVGRACSALSKQVADSASRHTVLNCEPSGQSRTDGLKPLESLKERLQNNANEARRAAQNPFGQWWATSEQWSALARTCEEALAYIEEINNVE